MSRFGNFGRCEQADECVLDPACEFYEDHLVLEDADRDEEDW